MIRGPRRRGEPGIGPVRPQTRRRPPARDFTPPAATRAALARLFGPEAGRVRVVEFSRHWAFWGRRFTATTRPGVIHLRGSGTEFLADPELVLEEYFHVLRQWDTGELTRLRYLAQWLRHGYARNPFEVAAKHFAAALAGELAREPARAADREPP